MELWTWPTSPFGAKVKSTVVLKGLDKQVQIITAYPWQRDTALPTLNPLGKIPALKLDDGQILYDSAVICEYLDSLTTTAQLFPVIGPQRWQALRLQALADGIMEAGVAARYESHMRVEALRSQIWYQRQLAVVQRGLSFLEQDLAVLQGEVTIGSVTTAVAIAYISLRFPTITGAQDYPALTNWYDAFLQRYPALQAVIPQDSLPLPENRVILDR
jgi:glutathione S-transferase